MARLSPSARVSVLIIQCINTFKAIDLKFGIVIKWTLQLIHVIVFDINSNSLKIKLVLWFVYKSTCKLELHLVQWTKVYFKISFLFSQVSIAASLFLFVNVNGKCKLAGIIFYFFTILAYRKGFKNFANQEWNHTILTYKVDFYWNFKTLKSSSKLTLDINTYLSLLKYCIF